MEQLQISTATIAHRHHHEFRILKSMAVSERLQKKAGEVRRGRILSFGCSTGEEAALLKKLFPDCDVFGVDINKEALAIARDRYKHIEFYESNSAILRSLAPFDFISICSVLCVHPSKIINGKTQGLAYDIFKDVMTEIFDLIDENGLFFLYNSNYPIRFHPIYRDLVPIDNPAFNGNGFVNLFSPAGSVMAYGNVRSGIYQAVGQPWHVAGPCSSLLEPEDFRYVLFRKRSACYGFNTVDSNILEASINFDEIDNVIVGGDFTFKYSDELLDKFNKKATTYILPEVTWKLTAESCFIRRTNNRVWFNGEVVYRSVVDYKLPALDSRWFLKQFRATNEFFG